MNIATILIAKGDEINFRSLANSLMMSGFQVSEKAKESDIFHTLPLRPPDLAIVGSYRDDASHELELAERIRRLDKNIPLILITLHSSEAQAIAALKVGVDDYFKWPCRSEEVLASIEHRLPEQGQALSAPPQSANVGIGNSRSLIGKSQSIQDLKGFLPKAAATDSTILITGETGTGKELVAELIHRQSPRRKQPIVLESDIETSTSSCRSGRGLGVQ